MSDLAPIVPTLPASQVLYIKHIVCPRGIRVVRQELECLGLRVLAVRLGAATVAVPPGGFDWPRLRATLTAAGFALLENPARDLMGCLAVRVAELLRQRPALRHRAFMEVLAQRLDLRPARLAAAFVEYHRGSLTTYITGQRLGYAQELLTNTALGIGAIARLLGYISLAHFSGQFRGVVGCSPTAYRQQAQADANSQPLPNYAGNSV